MNKYYSIGEVSRILDIPTSTLRYYDKIGLVKPMMIGENGYRYYGIEQFDFIFTILLYRILDISLEDMKKSIFTDNIDEIIDIFRKHEKIIDDKINWLKKIKVKLNNITQEIEQINKYENEVIVRKSPKLWYMNLGSEDDDDRIDVEAMEILNRKMDKNWVFMSQIGYFIREKNLRENKISKYFKYGMISEFECGAEDSDLEIIPSRLCAFSVYKGIANDIDKVYVRMLKWIEDNDFLINGDSIEKEVITLPTNEGENKHYIEIWIPIKAKNNS